MAICVVINMGENLCVTVTYYEVNEKLLKLHHDAF